MISQELVFRSLKGRCHGNQILLVLVDGCRWTQAASGAAGRARSCPWVGLTRGWVDPWVGLGRVEIFQFVVVGLGPL